MSTNLNENNSPNKINITSEQESDIPIPNEDTGNTQNNNNILLSSKLSINELNIKSNIDNPNGLLEKINSKSINDYINSLLMEIQKLNRENEELKLNFVQVSELREKEMQNYNNKINILKSNIEILEQNKQRHINQNIIEKENLENQIQILIKENNVLNKRIKEIIEQNEKFKKQIFDLNVINFGKNKKNFKKEDNDKNMDKNINNKNNININVNKNKKNFKEIKNNNKIIKENNHVYDNLKQKNIGIQNKNNTSKVMKNNKIIKQVNA